MESEIVRSVRAPTTGGSKAWLAPAIDHFDGLDTFKDLPPAGAAYAISGSDSPTSVGLGRAMAPQPRRAASIAATSIFLIVIIASNARFA